MRKTTFVTPLSCCIPLFGLFAFGMICLQAFAQDAIPAVAPIVAPAKEAPAVAMPSDPKELMILAAKTNGLTGDDVKPWHLKASFTMFDEGGNATDQGTFEEFWASKEKYKIVFTSKAFSQTDYGTEKGILRTGARDSAPTLFTQIENEFVNPILPMNEALVEHLTYDMQKRDQGGTKLFCLTEKGFTASKPPQPYLGSTYCLNTDIPALRISMRHGVISQFVHNNVASFQGHYLPLDLKGAYGLKLAIEAHLDKAEVLKTISESDFNPPLDAVLLPRQITISAGAAKGHLIQKVEPDYPPIAHAAQVSGTVVLQAVIGTDGHVLSLHVISGPAMLQQAALNAVKKWIYRPYLLNDEPVEVMTTINVFFTLGNWTR